MDLPQLSNAAVAAGISTDPALMEHDHLERVLVQNGQSGSPLACNLDDPEIVKYTDYRKLA